MGLETGTYINSLVATNPTATDVRSEGDDHLRLLKATLKNTFPNISGAVTPTHTELNYIAGITSAVQTQLNAKAALAGNAAQAFAASTFTGALAGNVTGNASTATQLATARNIDGQSFDGTAAITVIAPGTAAAGVKTTPIDADLLPLVDSAAANGLKKLSWGNLKATLKSYFDTLYMAAGGVLGTTTNDNAAAGYVGEYVETVVAYASGVSLPTSDIVYDVGSITLSAGDWDVFGMIGFNGTWTSGQINSFVGGASATSATLGPEGSYAQRASLAITSNFSSTTLAHRFTIPTERFSLAATTTIYLVAAKRSSGSNSVSAFGVISARRQR